MYFSCCFWPTAVRGTLAIGLGQRTLRQQSIRFAWVYIVLSFSNCTAKGNLQRWMGAEKT